MTSLWNNIDFLQNTLKSQLWASWMSSLPVSVPIFRWRMIPLEIFFRILTINTLWLALTGEFWGVFCELKIYLWYNAALYCWQKSYVHSLWVALYMNIYIYMYICTYAILHENITGMMLYNLIVLNNWAWRKILLHAVTCPSYDTTMRWPIMSG